MLTPEQLNALQATYGERIAELSQRQFDRVLELLAAGSSPREAISVAQTEFGLLYVEDLSKAFGEVLGLSIGTASVRALPVGEVTLARRLYLHRAATQGEVTAIIRQHAAGLVQARELAMRLYDGYDPQDGIRRPLEGSARAELPAALRALTEDRPARRSLARIIERGRAQAARLKSAPLRVGYLEALKAWEDGAGEAALTRKLENAVREKTRYFAQRIAQTELHRAQQTQVAREYMADDQLEVVRVTMSRYHPVPDVCDYHARADLYGLGPGLYPKARAPRPPYHPFCRCNLDNMPSRSASGARYVPGGGRAFLSSLPETEAQRVMGSRERLALAQSGADPVTVLDGGKDPKYRTLHLGDKRAGEHPLID